MRARGLEWVKAPPRADAKPMVGRRFGNLTVLALEGRRKISTGDQSRLLYRCRCDCGAEVVVDGAQLRRPEGSLGSTKRCRPCALRKLAAFNRSRSTPVGDGKTLLSIATESGVSLNTVTQRWLRGWPVERLGDPISKTKSRPADAGPSRKRGATSAHAEVTP